MFSHPALYTPLPTPEETTIWDSVAEETYGMPRVLLMENAARAAFNVLNTVYKIKPGSEVLVLAGGGSNGGDGIGLARRLHNYGCIVRVFTSIAPSAYTGASAMHLKMAVKAGVSIEQAPDNLQLINPAPIIIDALTGSGLKGTLRGGVRDLVRFINQYGQKKGKNFVMSLDIPSGLCALTGESTDSAVIADATVTFGAAKPGLCLPGAEEYTGTVHICDIGFPQEMISNLSLSFRLIKPRPEILKKDAPCIHKGQKGHVLIIGGSSAFSGAPLLAALAALRSGAALVTVAAPETLCQSIKNTYPEVTALPLPYNGRSDWSEEAIPVLHNFIKSMNTHSAIVFGPGIGKCPEVTAIAQAVAGMSVRPPMVLDADGLAPFRALPAGSLLPEGMIDLDILKESDVITPHPGEMTRLLQLAQARLMHMSRAEQSRLRLEDAALSPNAHFGSAGPQDFKSRTQTLKLAIGGCRATVILKGAATLIAKQGNPISILPIAESNLAVGGSGDVLSGIIAAIIARGFNLRPAALLRSTPDDDYGREMAANDEYTEHPLPPEHFNGSLQGISQPIFSRLDAASLGAYIHGRAGVLTGQQFPAGGNTAMDIINVLPQVLAELAQGY